LLLSLDRGATRLPYTTLFRSERQDGEHDDDDRADDCRECQPPAAKGGHAPLTPWSRLGWSETRRVRPRARLRFGHMPPAPSVVLDRKSTRLNSSHQIISYAVF